MKVISDADVVDYVLDRANRGTADAIEQNLREDEDLAAVVSLVTRMANLAPRSAVERKSILSAWIGRQFKRAGVILAILLGLSGLAWAAMQFLESPPLLRDNFNDGWLDVRLWKAGRRVVMEDNGYVRLMNRGSLVTQQEFVGPISVSLDWRWIDHAGDPLYAENFGVVLRTTGKHSPAHPFEILDGIVVQFHCMGGAIKVLVYPAKVPMIAETPDGSVPLPAGAWHKIRITDDGNFINVSVTGPATDPKSKVKSLLKVRSPADAKGKHVAFYNRELVASAVHESHVDNVVIEALSPSN